MSKSRSTREVNSEVSDVYENPEDVDRWENYHAGISKTRATTGDHEK